MRRNVAIIIVLILVALGAGVFAFIHDTSQSDQKLVDGTPNIETGDPNTVQKEATLGELSEEAIIDYTFELLSIFHRLYYITQDDSADAVTDSEVVLSMMAESMNDKNKLDDLVRRSQALAQSKDQVVSLTGMGLFVGLSELSESHGNWVNFLRSVDTDDVDMAEFRYQLALFQSSNKDAFNKLIESTSMYPYVFVKFANEGEENTIAISEEGQQQIKGEIERLFSDIFAEDEQWHEETGNTNAVVLIVKNYRDFLTGEE